MFFESVLDLPTESIMQIARERTLSKRRTLELQSVGSILEDTLLEAACGDTETYLVCRRALNGDAPSIQRIIRRKFCRD